MNAFEKLTEDIFNVPEFLDFFTYADGENTVTVKCIQYHSDNDAVFTEFGVDEGIDFTLVVKCKDYVPVKNAKITFHGKQYKVVSWTVDGFNLMANLNVKSLTSKG